MKICSICGGSKYSDALKEYNVGKPAWCMPRKGTESYAEVLKIITKNESVTKIGKVPQKRIEVFSPTKPVINSMEVKKTRKLIKAPVTKYYKYNTNVNSWAIYELESLNPPVLKSRFGETWVRNGDEYDVTIKKNETGKVLRTLKYFPVEDAFVAFASRGKKLGNERGRLERYDPTKVQLDFITGNKEQLTYTSPVPQSILKAERDAEEKRKPLVKAPEKKVLTDAELQKKEKARQKKIEKDYREEIEKAKKSREQLEEMADPSKNLGRPNESARLKLENLRKGDANNLKLTGNIYGVQRRTV